MANIDTKRSVASIVSIRMNGLRMLEKHAVTCGGGLNHRIGLDKKSGQIADLTCSANCAFRLSYSIAPKRASYPHRTGDW